MNEFLKSILDGIHYIVPSYGWSVVLFTILVRLCLMPLDYKSRVGMRKMSKLAPKQAELQKKYAKDQEKLQRKLGELYRKEQVSPMSGCWPMLVSMPILFAMFAAMRYMANEQLVQQAFDIILTGTPKMEPFLWVKNLWMPDSPFAAAWPNMTSLQMIETNQWLAIFRTLTPENVQALGAAIGAELTEASFASDALKTTIEQINTAIMATPGYAEQYNVIPYLRMNLLVTELAVLKGWNGLFLLPILSGVSQFVMTQLNPAQQQPAPTGENGQQQAGSGAFMKWFFPIFSLWLCSSYNAAFALYWVTSNLIAMAQNAFINWHLDRKDRLAAENPVSNDLRGNGNLK